VAKYAVELKASARKELEKLPAKLIGRIFPKLEALADEPRPVGCKKLKGGQQEWRIRVGTTAWSTPSTMPGCGSA